MAGANRDDSRLRDTGRNRLERQEFPAREDTIAGAMALIAKGTIAFRPGGPPSDPGRN